MDGIFGPAARTGIFTRVVSSGPSPDAGRSSQSEEFVLVAQNVRGGAAAASVVGFRRWPRRTAGRGLGSLPRFGDGVESVCCGGPQSSVGCGVRGRPSVIASLGSLQRHPARTGMDLGARRRDRVGRRLPRTTRGWTRGANDPAHDYVASPHTRGCSQSLPTASVSPRVPPAGAGRSLVQDRPEVGSMGWARARGSITPGWRSRVVHPRETAPDAGASTGTATCWPTPRSGPGAQAQGGPRL